MVNSRAKGSQFERSVATCLLEELGLVFKRDLEQYRQGDRGDLICQDMDFPMVIECKAYQRGTAVKPAWWDQVCKAARHETEKRRVLRPQDPGKLPLLVYKYDRAPWRWRMPAQVLIDLGHPHGNHDMADDAQLDWGYAVEMDTRTAMTLIREVLAHRDTEAGNAGITTTVDVKE